MRKKPNVLNLAACAPFLLVSSVSYASPQLGWNTPSRQQVQEVYFPFVFDVFPDKTTPQHYKSYYFATQANSFYFGVRPWNTARGSTEDKTSTDVVFSSFRAEAVHVAGDKCSPGADGGPGVSCALDYQMTPGEKYTFHITVTDDPADSTRNIFSGYVIDKNDVESFIASWSQPKSLGLITGSQLTFDEYIGYWVDNGAACAAYASFTLFPGEAIRADGTRETITISSPHGSGHSDAAKS